MEDTCPVLQWLSQRALGIISSEYTELSQIRGGLEVDDCNVFVTSQVARKRKREAFSPDIFGAASHSEPLTTREIVKGSQGLSGDQQHYVSISINSSFLF